MKDSGSQVLVCGHSLDTGDIKLLLFFFYLSFMEETEKATCFHSKGKLLGIRKKKVIV